MGIIGPLLLRVISSFRKPTSDLVPSMLCQAAPAPGVPGTGSVLFLEGLRMLGGDPESFGGYTVGLGLGRV